MTLSQPSAASPLAPISIASLKRRLAKHQQNGALGVAVILAI